MKEPELTMQVKYARKDVKNVYTTELVDFSGVSEASKAGEAQVSFSNPFYVPDRASIKEESDSDKKRKESVATKDMKELIRGIEEFGVLVPLIVRKKGDKYELLSGYRRKMAVEMINEHRAKKMKVPIIVVPDCDDDKATFILTTSNTHRSKITMKEQIKACGLAYRAMCRTERGKSYEEIAKEVGRLFSVSSDNVIRYSMLINLNDGLLELIGGEEENRTRKRSKNPDGKAGKIRLSRRAGVSLATLNTTQQKVLLDLLEGDPNRTISVKLAGEIRKKFKEEPGLTEDGLKEFIVSIEQEQSEDHTSEKKFESEAKSIDLNELLSEVEGKKASEIYVALRDFLKEWREAGSPAQFKVTSLS